jgi:hypothetical protein
MFDLFVFYNLAEGFCTVTSSLEARKWNIKSKMLSEDINAVGNESKLKIQACAEAL